MFSPRNYMFSPKSSLNETLREQGGKIIIPRVLDNKVGKFD